MARCSNKSALMRRRQTPYAPMQNKHFRHSNIYTIQLVYPPLCKPQVGATDEQSWYLGERKRGFGDHHLGLGERCFQFLFSPILPAPSQGISFLSTCKFKWQLNDRKRTQFQVCLLCIGFCLEIMRSAHARGMHGWRSRWQNGQREGEIAIDREEIALSKDEQLSGFVGIG